MRRLGQHGRQARLPAALCAAVVSSLLVVSLGGAVARATSASNATASVPRPAGLRFAYSNRVDQSLMATYGYNLIDVSTQGGHLDALIRFFHLRERRQRIT